MKTNFMNAKLDFLPAYSLFGRLLIYSHEKHLARGEQHKTRRRVLGRRRRKQKSNFIDDYVCHLCVLREIVLSIFIYFLFDSRGKLWISKAQFVGDVVKLWKQPGR